MKSNTEIPYIKRGRPAKRPSMEELSRLYGELSTKEIAEKYNTTPAVVRVWASKYRKESQKGE